jgi:hypothetical protein
MSDLYEQFDRQRRKVDVDNVDVTVRELVRMVNTGEIDRAAEYQRKFRWDEQRESKLIESVVLGLPVPTIFVATNRNGTWELVDGLQRVSSLVHFITEEPFENSYLRVGKNSALVLSGLEKLDRFNGLTFSKIPETIRLQFMKRALRVTAISDKSDKNVRFDTFERLNTGGVVLSPQEIRACVYRGKFIDFLEGQAQNKELNALLKLQRGRRDDGTLEEFVLKVFAYKDARTDFDGQVRIFLNSYCESSAHGFDISDGEEVFEEVCEGLFDLIRGPILKKGYGVTPLNLAEAIFVAAAELIDENEVFKPKSRWMEDRDLLKFSTKGTNTRAYLEGRIDRATQLLKGAKPVV